MKGTNTMKLNQATMQEAAQMWFDKMFVGAGAAKVTEVKAVNSSSAYESGQFEITVSVEEPKP